MKRAIFEKIHKIAHVEVPFPQIRNNQVLVKVINVGICGSDMHTFHGVHPTRKNYPLEFGHEMSGIVLKTGSEVRGFKAGDRVTVEPQQYCGTCRFCRSGHINMCRNARGFSVFMQEYAAVDSYMIHHCPGDMAFDQIALVEPVAVAAASVRHCAYKDARICVVGGGTIGNLIAQTANKLGAEDVMVTDFVESKLEFARKAGIPHCVNISSISLKDAILECFGDDGADVIIDAAGSVKGFESILDASRSQSQIVITATYSEPVEIMFPRIQRREISLIGHQMYLPEDYKLAIKLVYDNAIYTEGFISAYFDIDHVEDAFAYIEEKHGLPMKVMIQVGTPEFNDTDKELMK